MIEQSQNASSRVVVAGGGPGGLASAALLADRGFETVLYNRSPTRVEPVRERGGLDVSGGLGERFIALNLITNDPAEALEGAKVILVALPAYGQIPTLETFLPHLDEGAILVFLSGAAGTLEAAAYLRRRDSGRSDLVLAETSTLPLSARILGDTHVRVTLHSRLRLAALPATQTPTAAAATSGMFESIVTKNVLDPALNNPNFLIHPAPMLLNYAAVERTNGEVSLINEGMTPAVLRILDAVDREKMALQEALGLERLTIDQFYESSGGSSRVYRQQGENFGSGYRDRVWPRYVDEDVPYGSILYSEFGRLLGVPTPINDSINHVFSEIMEDNYWETGRTLERLGISGYSRDELIRYVNTGELPS